MESAYAAFERRAELLAQVSEDAHCLANGKSRSLSFYDLPAEDWHHIRTSNPDGTELIAKVIIGVQVNNGVEVLHKCSSKIAA